MSDILVVDPSPSLALELGNLLQRSGDRVLRTESGPEAHIWLQDHRADLVVVKRPNDALVPGCFAQVLRAGGPPIVLLTGPGDPIALNSWYEAGVAYCVTEPFHPRELISHLHAVLRKQKRFVCLGGGSGLYALLMGLKNLPTVHLTSIVSMSDDGGSSGRIRETFHILPPGDVRRSLVALSSAPELMNQVMQYRFREGEGLRDHNFGNLFLTAMASVTGSMAGAVRALGDILNIQGVVLPVTATFNTLMAELEDGTVLCGERRIDVPDGRDPGARVVRLWHSPTAVANPDALSAILAADALIIGPGDLFTSVIATLAVEGIAAAIRASRARKIYIANLMTEPGETSGFTLADHVREVVRYLERDVLDDVLVSNTAVSTQAVAHYAQKGQQPVVFDDESVVRRATKARVLCRDIGSAEELVRHDSGKLARELAELMEV